MRLAGAGIAAAILLTASARAEEPVRLLYDTDVVVDRQLVAGSEATVASFVSVSSGLRESRPAAGAEVEISLVLDDDRRVVARSSTDARGRAIARFAVPSSKLGRHVLVVRTRSHHGESEVSRPVEIVERTVVHLRTDRGIYKPGQILRWRLTGVQRVDARPLSRPAQLSIRDPRGTAIWQGESEVGRSGMVAGELPLGEDLVLGTYSITARIGDEEVKETFDVRPFALAPFRVEIDAPPVAALGQSVTADVVARYPSGEPVRGKAWLSISGGAKATAEEVELDGFGRARVSARVESPESVSVHAKVVDGAGRVMRSAAGVALASDRLSVILVADGPRVGDAPVWVTAITTDGQGRLVPAKLHLRVPGFARPIVRSSTGAVRFGVTPSAEGALVVSAIDGEGRVDRHELAIRTAPHAIRVADPLIGHAQRIEVRGHWPKPSGPVLVTLMRGEQPVATTAATVADGQLRAVLARPASVFGLGEIRVTEVSWDRANGNLRARSAGSSVFLEPEHLSLDVRAPAVARPGSEATIDVTVRDRQGHPVPGVGLAASVIDERVLALREERPGLVEALRSLDMRSAEVAGIHFAALLRKAPSADERRVMAAIVRALPTTAETPQIHVAAAQRLAAELLRIRNAQQPVYDYLYKQARPLGMRDGKGQWEFADALPTLLAGAGFEPAAARTPWGRPLSWSYARELDAHWTFDATADRIADERLDELAQSLWKKRALRRRFHRGPAAALASLVDRKRIPGHLVIDPWGTPVRLDRSPGAGNTWVIDLRIAGPDLRFGTADDRVRGDLFAEAEGAVGYGVGGMGYGSGHGMGGGRFAQAPSVRIGSAGPVVAATRKRFDETVLWLAGEEADAKGRARFSVLLADSITGWQIDVEALSAAGAIGAARSRIETRLPLHVDAEIPQRLTVGDRFEITAVAANHQDLSQALDIAVSAREAVTILGTRSRSVRLEAGTTRAARFALRADSPGQGTVRLELRRAGVVVDAVERTITIEPPGPLQRRLAVAPLEKGTASLELEVPEAAVAETLTATLRALRSPADLAMEGLEGMLREPHGCFEQTSSTTYPNLLVLDLLRNQKGAEPLRARAHDLVGKGYQRLISYEVDGGGFSWFGESPANQVLTAYGLMEFSDMSRVYPVDPKLIERTREWLLSKQRADGSWKPDASWLHDWSAVQGDVTTTAFVAWALAESGARGRELDRALAFLRRHRAALERDPYSLALWAATESRVHGKGGQALASLSRRREASDGDAAVYRAGGATLFYAQGDAADVQVTALAASSLALSGRDREAREAMRWVKDRRSPNYGWGTTQGTVLALRAATFLAKEAEPRGSVTVSIDGKTAGRLLLSGAALPTFELPRLQPGRHRIELVGEDQPIDFDLRWSWRESQAPTAEASGMKVSLQAVKTETLRRGDELELEVSVAHDAPASDIIAMPTVVAPVPPGFSAEARSLEALRARAEVAKVEDQGSEIHVYLRELRPGGRVRLPLRLRADSSCDVAVAPAHAYAYYDPSVRGASEPMRLRVSRH